MLRRKIYWSVFVAAIVCIIAVFYAISQQAYQNDAKLQGRLVFAKTFDLGHKLNRIIITTAEDIIELKQNDSYWYVVNKGDYYADFSIVHRFLTSINKSIYTIKLPYNQQVVKDKFLLNPDESKEDSGMLIKTYIDDKLLDEVIIGLPDDNGLYFFAKDLQNNEIWLINGDFNLPIIAKDWLLNPVLSVPSRMIETLSVDDKIIQREIENGVFYDNQKRVVFANPLLDVLNNITVVNAMSAEKFNQTEFEKTPLRTIKAVTFYGLEFICTVYQGKGKKAWLNIKLSTTPLPMATVNDYIRDNRVLYDGWYFEISPEQQHILCDFRLI